MNYANYLASIEPYNYQCKIIGFDTFSGGVGVSKKDENNYSFEKKMVNISLILMKIY